MTFDLFQVLGDSGRKATEYFVVPYNRWQDWKYLMNMIPAT